MIIVCAGFSIPAEISAGVSGRFGEPAPTDEIIYKFKAEDEPRLMKLSVGDNFSERLSALTNDDRIEFAEANYLYKASIIPSDTYFNNQWYLKKIKAPAAWDTRSESPQIVIAVIDSGVDISHPDLINNLWINRNEKPDNGIDDDGNGFIDDTNGWDFVSKTADPKPKFDKDWNLDGIMHGTVVAGIIAASGNNAAGISGVTWRAQLMPLRVLDGKGQGRANDVIKAIDYAVANGADLINLSFNGFDYSQGMNEAVKRAFNAGVIVVAAAGNELSSGKGYNLADDPMYPVCFDGSRNENWVIGVAATDVLDQKTAFSSYGFNCVDLSAPGVSIYGTSVYAPDKRINDKNLNLYYDGYWSGTSVAAPQVTGALALLEAANPRADRKEIIKFLLEGTDNISRLNPEYLGQLGHGRLNVDASLDLSLADIKSHTTRLLFAPASGSGGAINITDSDGRNGTKIEIADEKQNGAQVAAGDVNGDGRSEIVTAPGPGTPPAVNILDQAGIFKKQFFAYAENFRGGVNLAVGDVNGDGTAEIITGPGAGGGPQVRIFNFNGRLLAQFFAYSKSFRGGVNLAVGDVNGDGTAEIITGPGAGGGPHVRVFNNRGDIKLQFFAYDKNFRGGVRVASADIDNKVAHRQAEIITGPGAGGGPHLKIFDRRGVLRIQFLAFDPKFRGGLSVAAADVNRDGAVEIIAAAGPGGGPHIRTFSLAGKLLDSFYGLAETFRGGVNVSMIEN
jgi:subtilisin family serine protease